MSNRSRLLPRTLILGLLFGPWVCATPAATPNRIPDAFANGVRVAVNKTVPARARLATDMGEASGSQLISSVGLHFSLTAAQQADLNQLLADQQNPASPHYHQWLTPQQYGARFGLSNADLAKVKTWLQGQGLSVTSVSPSMNYVTVSGTVAQIDAAFATAIHTVSENGVTHISNLSDPALPAALANVVNGITGLNDFKPKARARVSVVRGSAVNPRYTSSVSGSHYIAPGDFYTIYDLKPLIGNSINGSGIKIAVAGQTDISTTDVANFRSASGLPASAPTILPVPGYVAGTVSADLDEAQLDVEWSGAAAPGANIVFVTVGASQTASVMDSLVYAITSNPPVAPIISISYGGCETGWGQSYLNTYNQYLQQANAQGITVVGPSGDSGATDCDYQETSATQGLAVDFPASSPYVTAAGGTMFNEGSGNYWSSSNDNYSGSALSYIPETVWNETDSTGLSAGGGGISSYFAKPSWQVGTGVPNDLARDVPDISLNSAAAHDGYLFCSRGSCTNGYRNASGNLTVVGGTSVASPTFAGILALLEQQLGNTTGLGNVNPMIYGLANSTYYGNVFHDVTTGNNNSPCVAGTKDCPSGGSIGYGAGAGYDRATGWGSIDGYNFVTKWSLVTPAGTGTTIGSALSNTTITSSAALCGVSTGSITFTVQVTGSGGTPSGTVQILVDNAPLSDPGSTLTLDANGSATYQVNATNLSGGHTITAVYSGSSIFAGSKATTTADFVYSAQKDFAVTPCTSTVMVKTGGTTTATFTLTPFNGFTGNVALTATPNGALATTLSFSPATAAISSTGTVNVTLTVAAYQNSAALRTGNSQTVVAAHHTSRMPWYGAAGSGAALACTLLLTMPRRRRWGALLAAVVSVATFTAIGCGGGGSSSSSSSGSGPSTTTTPATPGTYNVTVSGTSGNLVHSTTFTLTVTQ